MSCELGLDGGDLEIESRGLKPGISLGGNVEAEASTYLRSKKQEARAKASAKARAKA
jgi:hypothetical protein